MRVYLRYKPQATAKRRKKFLSNSADFALAERQTIALLL